MGRVTYFPTAGPFVLLLLLLLLLLLFLLLVKITGYAFTKLGFSPIFVWALLAFTFLGGAVNLPVKTLVSKEVIIEPTKVSFFGLRYIVPGVEEKQETLIAVNLGGAVVPALVSLYLIIATGAFLEVLVAVAVTSLVIHRVARPIPGVGIGVPVLIPPLAAAVISLLISPKNSAPVAYISGTLGTLIGADLLNLGRVKELRAPVISVGGAGTFDGIFLAGIIAVLLA